MNNICNKSLVTKLNLLHFVLISLLFLVCMIIKPYFNNHESNANLKSSASFKI